MKWNQTKVLVSSHLFRLVKSPLPSDTNKYTHPAMQRHLEPTPKPLSAMKQQTKLFSRIEHTRPGLAWQNQDLFAHLAGQVGDGAPAALGGRPAVLLRAAVSRGKEFGGIGARGYLQSQVCRVTDKLLQKLSFVHRQSSTMSPLF